MSNYIKTLILSTIVLVMSNNNCYSQSNKYADFYEYLEDNKSELPYGSDEITQNITKMISGIKNKANEAFMEQQITSRSYTKFLCYLNTINISNDYSNGKYTMLYIIKEACNEFLKHSNIFFANHGINTDNEKLQELYQLINTLKTYAQTNLNNIENVFRRKNMRIEVSEQAKNKIEKCVTELMKVWEKCHKKK